MPIVNSSQPTVNVAVPVPVNNQPQQQPVQQQPSQTLQQVQQTSTERFVQKPFLAVHSLIFPYRSVD